MWVWLCACVKLESSESLRPKEEMRKREDPVRHVMVKERQTWSWAKETHQQRKGWRKGRGKKEQDFRWMCPGFAILDFSPSSVPFQKLSPDWKHNLFVFLFFFFLNNFTFHFLNNITYHYNDLDEQSVICCLDFYPREQPSPTHLHIYPELQMTNLTKTKSKTLM